MSLPDLIGDKEAEVAVKLMDTAADVSAKMVFGDIEAHKEGWNERPEEERWRRLMRRPSGRRASTGIALFAQPAPYRALVVGEPVTAPAQKLEDGEITETQRLCQVASSVSLAV